MKKLRKTIKYISSVILTVGLALNFSGCSKESTVGPTIDEEQSSSVMSLAKKKNPGIGIYDDYIDWANDVTVKETATFLRDQNCYSEVKLFHPNGSFLNIPQGALSPPEDVTLGEPVTITMNVTKDQKKNELLFTFGQSGCTFDPSATVTLCWNDLGFTDAKLYYLEGKKEYIPQSPDDVDYNNKLFKISISHFSRYAIGAE